MRWNATDSVPAVLDRAEYRLRRRRVRECLDLLDHAEALGADPLATGGLRWKACMLLGDFAGAWAVSDTVLTRTGPAGFNRRDRPFHQRAVWDGSPLGGRRVLVRCYHGLGDIIHFARYLPLVAGVARRLTVQAPVPLHALLARVPGVEGVFALGDDAALPPFDVDAELMELPHAFRSTLATLPAGVPYLTVEPERVVAQAARLGGSGGLRVGLAWAAGAWDGGHRSLPPNLLGTLAAVPGVDWVCLQRGPAVSEADGRLGFRDQGPCTDDAEDTAAMMRALDLVVSVDTMVAHLAGALAVPVWTLLTFEADWRWMLGRDDCLWYPTMRLFRQPVPGDWTPVLAAVAAALPGVTPRAERAGR
ncbi:MAG TPA: hypothetical protein VGE72_14150 [Azospirillum sp.]